MSIVVGFQTTTQEEVSDGTVDTRRGVGRTGDAVAQAGARPSDVNGLVRGEDVACCRELVQLACSRQQTADSRGGVSEGRSAGSNWPRPQS